MNNVTLCYRENSILRISESQILVPMRTTALYEYRYSNVMCHSLTNSHLQFVLLFCSVKCFWRSSSSSASSSRRRQLARVSLLRTRRVRTTVLYTSKCRVACAPSRLVSSRYVIVPTVLLVLTFRTLSMPFLTNSRIIFKIYGESSTVHTY